MSGGQDCGIRDFSQYDVMTTEELERILRLDAAAPEGQESDTELILYVMEVLANRKRKDGSAGKTPQEAYASFLQNYAPAEAEAEDEPAVTKVPGKKRSRWFRSLTAAAAVLAIVICTALTASAWELDLWNVVAKWAKETFSFASRQTDTGEPRANSDLEFSTLQDALSKYNIDPNLVPTWFPEGYSLYDITIDDTPLQRTVIARYRSGEQSVKIIVKSFIDMDSEKIEQSDDGAEVYTVNGTEYYLFADNDLNQAVWVTDTYECYISGTVTIDQLKMMIDSIGKG